MVVAFVIGGIALYNSPAFTIEEVSVNGVEHLTNEEMETLVNVPEGSTLLRIDTDAIAANVKKSAWIKDVQVNRLFPSTLEVNVTERPVLAIVEIPTSSTKAVKKWAIADDYVWLMPIPEVGSEGAKTTSSKIYEDDENVLHVKELPFDTKAEIGRECTDANVVNALDIITGLTTELADRVVEVQAKQVLETRLFLDNGVEVEFGAAENIRDKERAVLKLLEENDGKITSINVRDVNKVTHKSI